MRALSAAIVLSLITVIASAQTLQRKPSVVRTPGAVTLRHSGPVPRVYTPQQRTVAVQKLLNLALPPTLGQPVSLTPGTPYIAGLAELDFGDAAMVVGGNMHHDAPVGGQAVWTTHSGYVDILFNARANQRYVVDCRSLTGAPHINYTVNPGNLSGTAPLGQDGHFLIALDKAPTNGMLIVTVDHPQSDLWFFYGCEISPF